MKRFLIIFLLMASACWAQSGIGGGGSGSGSSISGAYYLSTSSCGGATNCTQINADGHAIFDATTVSTSSTITCPNSDCNFTGTDSLGRPNMKVGQVIWAVTGSGQYISTTIACPQSTVASFTAQSVTVATASDCTASNTANAGLYWGDDDGATLKSTIATNCINYVFPTGSVIITSQPFGYTRPTCATTGLAAATGNPIASMSGGGSTFIMTPNFVWTNCPATPAACFGSGLGRIDYAIWNGTGLTSASNANCSNANGKAVLADSPNATTFTLVDIAGICPGESVLIGVLLTQPDTQLSQGGAQDVGVLAGKVTGVGVLSIDNDFHNLDVVGTDGSVNGLFIAGSAALTDLNSSYLSQVGVNGTFSSRGAHIIRGQGTSNAAIYLDTGGAWYSVSDFVGAGVPGVSAANIGLQINATSGTVQASNTQFTGTAAGIFASGNGGKFISLGGNAWITGIPSQNSSNPPAYSGIGVLTGTCQGTATSSATLGLYLFGENTTPNCTSTTVNLGYVVPTVPLSGSVAQFMVNAGTACKSGNTCVFTVMKTHAGTTAATTITCSMTAGASTCQDATHTDTPTIGDVYSVQFTTGATETLANVTATLLDW